MRTLLTLIALSITCTAFAQGKKEVKVGDKAPVFKLADQDGKVFNSADYLGKKNIVIFFYPKDESLVCTKEACAFRDKYAEFEKAGAVVVGINGGSAESHRSFQQKEKLPYSLLVDQNNTVIKSFSVPDKIFMTGRETFIIDKSGKIAFAYNSSLNGSKHALDALAYLQKH